MFNFKSAKEVNQYFQAWHSGTINESKRLQPIRDLRNIGALSKMAGDPVEVDFKCPLYGFGLARSCRLTSCQYYLGPQADGNFESDNQAEAAAA